MTLCLFSLSRAIDNNLHAIFVTGIDNDTVGWGFGTVHLNVCCGCYTLSRLYSYAVNLSHIWRLSCHLP